MSDLVRSWKDPQYRAALPAAPDSPNGIVELPESDLAVAGGTGVDSSWGGTCQVWTYGCCGQVQR